jgi:hypothetical protein
MSLRVHVHVNSVPEQGCQMEYLQNKNPNLGKFWSAWEWKMFVLDYAHSEYITAIW